VLKHSYGHAGANQFSTLDVEVVMCVGRVNATVMYNLSVEKERIRVFKSYLMAYLTIGLVGIKIHQGSVAKTFTPGVLFVRWM